MTVRPITLPASGRPAPAAAPAADDPAAPHADPAYHGMTAGALSATGGVAVRERGAGGAAEVTRLPYPSGQGQRQGQQRGQEQQRGRRS
ncbi:hypothetical protein ACFRMN_10175 [Streptomyces sp. NPDC056835]|uniref:hypothetical protein n=1 Tax=Streptomyces sp. NPDC056835 TaxID=3345956 RepID=UPI00368A92EB